MVARFPLCERRQLELAVADRLSQRESEQLSQHLESCSHCRTELEQLAGSHDWWQSARTYLSSTDNAGAANAWSSGTTGLSSSVSLAQEEELLDFLEPADDPTLLGRLGGYNVESVIGRGGMGIVLKAQETALARAVAIKVLASPLATSSAARKRFAREAKAAAAVVHDHVIPIYAVDTSGRVPFLVMPYITGRSLQDRLDACGHLETKELLRIAVQAARGLAAAHAQGLVHRDIKPANILLENGVERVRITDFGLARAIDDASQTQSGFIAGTPQYMAPEQARGEAVDARADLFSLGSVMYAMCTGHPPFRAETTLAVLRRICDDPPRPLREVNADVPAWLAAIIHKLLAKSPADRFPSADEVADLLERWLAHLQQPTIIKAPHSRPAVPVGRASRIALSSAAVVAFAAIAYSIWSWRAEGVSPPVTGRGKVAQQAQQEDAPDASAQRSNLITQEHLSVQALDSELDQVRRKTLAADIDTQPTTIRFTADHDIAELQWRLNNLETELRPLIPNSSRKEPK